jgi:hypothetical protein
VGSEVWKMRYVAFIRSHFVWRWIRTKGRASLPSKEKRTGLLQPAYCSSKAQIRVAARA